MNLHRIRIGVGVPLSGPSRSMGLEMKQAIEMAVADANAAAQAPDATFEILVADDHSDADHVESIAQRLCSETELLGVVGHYNSDVTLRVAPIYASAGVPMITPIASNPNLTERGLPNVFRFTNRDDRAAMAIARFLREYRGKTQAVVVESRSAYGQSMAQQFVNAFQQMGGTVADRHSVDAGQRDFGQLVSGLRSGFDLLFYGGTFEGPFLLSAMRSAGYDQLFAAGDGCWDTKNFLEPAGDSLSKGEGVLVLAATPEIGYVPGSDEFAQRYRRRFGPITNYAVNSYDAACALIEAVRLAARHAAGMPDRAAVLAAMRSLQHQGIAYPRPTAWDEKGDNLAAVTALYDVVEQSFHQVAVIDRELSSSA